MIYFKRYKEEPEDISFVQARQIIKLHDYPAGKHTFLISSNKSGWDSITHELKLLFGWTAIVRITKRKLHLPKFKLFFCKGERIFWPKQKSGS